MPIPLLNFRPQESLSLELEITDLSTLYERASKLKHDPSKPHRVKFYHLIYITDGSGSHFIDFNNYSYKSGSFVFISKDQIHAFDFNNRPQGKAIFFTQNFLDSTNVNIRMPFFTSNLMSLNSPILTIDNRLKHSFETILGEIDHELSCSNSNSLIAQFLFSALLLKLGRERPASCYDNQLTEHQAVKFLQVINLIENNFSTNREASAYAKMMHMTYKSLNKICKLACNLTPKQLIDSHTILEAKRRLVIEKVQINQLAFDLGFDEVSNFIKYFKKHTLLTPAQFKSNHSG